MRIATVALMAAIVAACPADRPSDDAGEQPIAPAEGRPPLAELVADIRDGLADIPQRVAGDPEDARRIASELYATRQELIEEHYGQVDLDHVTPALADQVERAEDRFHALLRRLGESPPDTVAVRASVDSLFAELENVLAEARRAGVIPAGS